jgi:hypothetical protein
MGTLYHYSLVEIDVLRSLRKQGLMNDEEKIKIARRTKYSPGNYFDHISFFLEPVPLDTIAACFKHTHPFWKSGTELFEHAVDIKKLKDFKYQIVESPLKTAIYDHFPETPSMDEETWDNYQRLVFELQKTAHEVGESNKMLLEIQTALMGKTKEYFERIRFRNDFENIRLKYAATVPHVMLYPKTGLVNVDSVRKVKIK